MYTHHTAFRSRQSEKSRSLQSRAKIQVSTLFHIQSHWSITRCMVAERGWWQGHLNQAGRGQPRTCMPKKRGTRSGLRREFREVRATALRKLRGSKIGLSKYQLQVLAQQIRADVDRIVGDGTGTASSSHTAGATTHGCHGGHGQVTHAGNPTERSTAGRDERNLDSTQYEGIDAGSGPVRVAGHKDPPQGATLRRASDVMENFRV